MIRVRCVGHIATGVGSAELNLEGGDLEPSEIVDKVREASKDPEPGFTRYNTLVLVEEGEAFSPASEGRRVRSGESVVLIPISHGG